MVVGISRFMEYVAASTLCDCRLRFTEIMHVSASFRGAYYGRSVFKCHPDNRNICSSCGLFEWLWCTWFVVCVYNQTGNYNYASAIVCIFFLHFTINMLTVLCAVLLTLPHVVCTQSKLGHISSVHVIRNTFNDLFPNDFTMPMISASASIKIRYCRPIHHATTPNMCVLLFSNTYFCAYSSFSVPGSLSYIQLIDITYKASRSH